MVRFQTNETSSFLFWSFWENKKDLIGETQKIWGSFSCQDKSQTTFACNPHHPSPKAALPCPPLLVHGAAPALDLSAMGGVPNLTGLSFEHSNAAIPRRIKPDVTVANSLPPRRRTDNPHVSLEVPSPTCFYAVSLSRSFSACSLLRQETSDPRNTAPRQKGASSSDFLPSPSDRDKSAFEETGVDSSPSPSPSASLPLDPIPRSAMSTCYRRILNTSISPPSDLSFRRPHLRPVSVRSASSDGITRALRSTSVSWTPEPAVDRSLGGRGTRRGKGSPAVMCLSAMGEMIGEVEVEGQRSRAAEVLAAAAVTVVLGTGNRVLQKLALVPLKEYPFFLAQFTTFG